MSNTDTPLSYAARSAGEAAQKSITTLIAEVERLERLLDERTGTIKPLLPYPLAAVVQRSISSYSSPEKAKAAVEAAYQESLPIREQNAVTAAENARILSALVAMINNAGVPSQHNVWRGTRQRGKWETETYDWNSNLRSAVQIYDRWSEYERSYKQWIADCDNRIRAREAEEQKATRERAVEEAKFNREVTRRAMCAKYGCAPSATLRDVLGAIIGQDKYLRLGHYLWMNRQDWSDGPDYAKMGLEGFDVVSETDRLIDATLRPLIDDWDMDGRVFRDCAYSYDVLFGMAQTTDAEIARFTDYETVRDLLEE